MRREIAVLCCALLVALPAGTVAGEDPDGLVVADVTVTPAPPDAGAEFTVEATIENAGNSGYEITEVSLLGSSANATGFEPVDPDGLVVPGDGRTVELDGRIEEAGVHRLRLRVAARTDGGARVSVRYPFRVAIGGEHPRLDVDAGPGIAGAEATVSVTVSNGLESGVRDLHLDLSGDGLDVETGPHARPRLGAGASATYAFSVTPETAGRRPLVATLAYTDANGSRHTVRREAGLRVRPASTLPLPDLAVSMPAAYAGTRTTATLTVANGREDALRNLTATLSGPNVSVRADRRVRSRLGAGKSASFEFPVLAATGGERSVTAAVSYTDPTGLSRTARREATLRFRPVAAIPDPRLAIEAEGGVAGTESPATVTVANPLDVPLRDVELRLAGAGDARRIRPRLAPGESVAFDLSIRPTDPGRRTIEARLNATAHGERLSVTSEARVRVEPVRDRAFLDVRPGEGTVTIEVINAGNAAIEDVLLGGNSPNATVSRTLLERVPAGESATAVLNVSRARAAGDISLSVVATYDVAGRRGRANATVALASNPGAIALTGLTVDETDDGDALHVSGSASNVGLTDARSVVVDVIDAANVTPAPPNREYFVGTVPASDFVSFDVYAAVRNVSTIPIRVTYLVDGERRERTVEVPYEGARSEREQGGDAGSTTPYAGAIGVAVLVAVIGFALVGWRNRGE